MNKFRLLVAVYALCLIAGADPDDDKKGAWIHSIDDAGMFESSPPARAALDSKKIKLVASGTELTTQLSARAKQKGAIVIIDGAQMLANPTQALEHALLMVKEHGANATYIYLSEPSDRVLPDILTDAPLRANGPINASGIVESAIQKQFPKESDRPERIVMTTKTRAQAVLKNDAMLGSPKPSDFIPWASGTTVVVHAHPVFDRRQSGPTPLAAAIMKAASEEKKPAYIGYEVIGGESPAVATRLLALSAECRAGITKPTEFRIQIYSGGDDKRSAVTELAKTRGVWLAKLNSTDQLFEAATVKFSVTPHHLYGTETILDGERTIEVPYTSGTFRRTDKIVTLKLRYNDGRILVDSPETIDAVTVLGNKKGDAAKSVANGTIEIPTDGGPIVEARIRTNTGAEVNVILVDPRHRDEVIAQLFADPPKLDVLVNRYTKAVYEGGTFTGSSGIGGPGVTSGTGTTVLAPPTGRPIIPVIQERPADPSLLDKVKFDFADLGERARNQKTPPFEIMDEDAIRAMAITIAKPEFGNLLILGEPGSGKTVVVEAFIHAVVNGNVRGVPKSTVFLEIDSSKLVGGTMYRGQLEQKLEALFEASEHTNIVLFADEAHGLLGAGRTMGSDNDIFQGKFKRQMANGKLRIIGTSTHAEAEKFLEDPALADRFARYDVKPWPKDKVLKAMASWMRRLKLPEMRPELMEYLYELSEQFAPTGGQPRKVAKLMNEYFAAAKVDGFTEYSRENIQKVAKPFYDLHDSDFDPEAQARRIEDIMRAMNQRIVGQTKAKDYLYEALQNQLWNLGEKDGAALRVLFTGPPGLGKTELALAFGEARAPGRTKRIPMSGQYGRDATALFAYIGSLLSRNGRWVLFFDEFEKAPRSVQEAFLTALDKGYIDYSPGGTGKNITRVYLKNTDIIMASNAGSDYIKSHQGEGTEEEHAAMKARGLEKAYERTHQGPLVLRDMKAAMIADNLSEPIVSRFATGAIPFVPASEKEFREILNAILNAEIAELAGRDTVGPLEIHEPSRVALLDALTKMHWTPEAEMRTSADDLKLILKRSIRAGLIAAGRKPKEKVPDGCAAILIELGLP